MKGEKGNRILENDENMVIEMNITFDEYLQMQIEYWNQNQYVQKIRKKMGQFAPMFEDMISLDPYRQFSYDEVLVITDPHFVYRWDGTFNERMFSITISGKSLKRHPNSTLLHEMIHMHEAMLSEDERTQCQMKLKRELLKKIPGLSTIMARKDEFMMQLCPAYTETVKMTHSDLFFLKSLDLDLCFPKYKLGTVGGYNFREAIDVMQAIHII